MMTKPTPKYLWAGVLVFIFLIILLINIMTPRIADDYGYMFYFGAGYPRYIDSLMDLIGSQTNHYNMWGGRVIGHSVAQILLRINPLIASILNASMYMFFVGLIYRYITKNNKRSLLLFLLINLFVWFFIPAFGDTILWITGSANYLWCTTIILVFLYPYCFAKHTRINLFLQLIYASLFLICGVMIGWTNENTVAGVIIMVVLLILKYYKANTTIPLYFITGFVGLCVGYFYLITAPGNSARATIDLSLMLVIKRFIEISATLFSQYGWLLIIIGALLFVNRYHQTKLQTIVFELPVLFTIGGIVSIYVMLASPQFPERSWFSIIVFFLIAIGLFLQEVIEKQSYILHFLRITFVVGLVGFVFTYMIALKDIYRVRTFTEERVVIAEKAIAEGKKKAYFKPIKIDSRYVHSEDDKTNDLLSYFYKIYIEFEY